LVVISGDPGTGKSTFAIWLGYYISLVSGKPWDWREHIHYEGEPFVKAIHRENDQYSLEIMNEGGESFHNLEWYTDIAREMSKATMRDRIFKKPKVVIVPFSPKLAKDIRSAADYKVQNYYYRGSKYARIWEGRRPVAPYQKYPEPFWQEILHRYVFQPLPPTVQGEYDLYDMKAKSDMANKYSKTKEAEAQEQRGKIDKYAKIIKDRLKQGRKYSNRDDVYNELRPEGVTFSQANTIWNKAKES